MTREASDLRGWLESFVFEAGFLDRYPYYAHVLAQLQPVLDPSVELLGVSLASSSSGARYYLHVHVESVRRAPQFLRGSSCTRCITWCSATSRIRAFMRPRDPR